MIDFRKIARDLIQEYAADFSVIDIDEMCEELALSEEEIGRIYDLIHSAKITVFWEEDNG